MICQKCQQRNASVHITQIINNEKKEIHLCEQCAQEHKELTMGTSINFTAPFGINDLLAGFLGKDNKYGSKPKVSSSVCNVCGMTYEQFTGRGKLGCANCYNVFKNTLEQAFKRIHGNTNHNGKVPTKAGSKVRAAREIEKLKNKLNKAVQAEEYEAAAELRDEIRQMEANLKEE
jgi:protein arginine kinase activator